MDDVELLIAAGDLAAAAGLLESTGEHARAADLYQQIWDFAGAARAARRAGDLPGALENTLRGGVPAEIEEVMGEVNAGDPAVRLRCAEACEARGAFARAAELYAGADEPTKAAGLFERAGLLLEAAKLFEQADERRHAMKLYRRHLGEAPSSGPALFSLGRLLLRYGQQAEAIPLLQQATALGGAVALPAGIAVVAALHRIGYPEAAKEALGRLASIATSAVGPGELPETVTACMQRPDLAPVQEDDRGDGPLLAGRYRLGRLLGSGGMGRVYHARDELRGRAVAVKVFTAPGGARGRDAYQRFVREAKATGRLQHPHIVSLFDFNEEMGFIVLEYMAGGDLAARLRPRIDLASARSLMLQVLSGLAAAHQRGIVHRDLKPSNIFFSTAGAAKLGDFGVAHLQDSAQTQTGGFIGTLAYMSPEQITGGRITFATDVYSLGVTLFVMLTGQLPFTPPGLVEKHLHQPPPRPSALQSDVPSVCDEVVLRCLAKQPGDRFDSLAALVRAVERFPQTEGPVARPLAADQAPAGRRAADARFTVENLAHEHPALQVLKARDNELGRAVTLLRLAPGDGRQPLLALLRAAARADVHLQRVVAIDHDGGSVVLESWSGDEPQELAQRLSGRPTDPLTALQLCHHLALALAPLHQAGVAHGRVAPATVTRWGDLHVLGLTEALIAWTADPKLPPGPPGSIEQDIEAVGQLCGLEPPEEVRDGASLVAWAAAQLAARRDREHLDRGRRLLDRALSNAPPEVDRG